MFQSFTKVTSERTFYLLLSYPFYHLTCFSLLDLVYKFIQGRCLLIKKYFCIGFDYAGKADLSTGYWNSERKLQVAGHFLEIVKQQLF